MTEEEKAAKLAELRQKLAEKRAMKSAEELEQAKRNEVCSELLLTRPRLV